MVNRISKVNCIGLQLPSDDCSFSGDLPMIPLTGQCPDQHPDIGSLIETIRESYLVLLVASLDEGHDNHLLDVCSTIMAKSIRLILVAPEPQYGYELTHLPVKARGTVSGVILVYKKSLNLPDLNASNVFPDTVTLDDLLLHPIEQISEIIDQRFFLGLDIADIFTILLGKGIIRIGTGITSGPDRSGSATAKALSAIEQQGGTIGTATRILCNMCGSNDMTMHDYDRINRLIHDSISEETLLKLTVTRNDEMGKSLMVTIWAV
jgi:hypothetical protein